MWSFFLFGDDELATAIIGAFWVDFAPIIIVVARVELKMLVGLKLVGQVLLRQHFL